MSQGLKLQATLLHVSLCDLTSTPEVIYSTQNVTYVLKNGVNCVVQKVKQGINTAHRGNPHLNTVFVTEMFFIKNNGKCAVVVLWSGLKHRINSK